MLKPTIINWFRHPWPEIGLVTLVTGFVWWLGRAYHSQRKPLPPGPRGWPWIGYTPCLGSDAFDELQKLKEDYGDIVSFTLLGKTVVVLNTYEAVHEASIGHRAKVGRYTLTTNHWLAQGTGISNYDTSRALELRQALFRHLYGQEDVIKYLDSNLHRTELSEMIEAEIDGLLRVLENEQGKPTEMLPLARYTMWNIMWRIVFGNSCPLSREQIESLLNRISKNNTENSMLQFIQLFPKQWLFILNWIPWALRMLGMDELYHRYTTVHTSLRNQLEAYEKSPIKSKTALIYRLQNDHRLAIQRKELERLLFELMAAGTDTSSLTITAACAFLSERTSPMIDGDVTMQLNQIHRQASVVPLALPHVTRQPIHMAGYCIPSGSILLFNLYAIHQAQLREKGPAAPIPFSMGSRACPGNRLASKILEDIIKAIDQKFTVSPSRSIQSKSDQNGLEQVNKRRGLTQSPEKSTFVFQTR